MARKPSEKRPVRDIIQESEIPQQVLADKAGLSYATLRSWITGRRSPTPESISKLADALDSHGLRLQQLAREVRRG